MTEFWCQTCEEFRGNYVGDHGELRGIECGHELFDPHAEAGR